MTAQATHPAHVVVPAVDDPVAQAARPVPESRADFTSLGDRMSHLLVLRVAIGGIVAIWAVLRPEALVVPLTTLAALTAAYLAVAVTGELVRRRTSRFDYTILTTLLLIDGLYLASAMYATGATQSPIRFVVYLHLVAVSLLALVPDRVEDRPVALAPAVRRRLRPGRPARLAGRRHAGGRPSSSTGCRSSTSPRSGCSRSRPRSSRPSTSVSCASAAPTSRRSSTSGPGSTRSRTPSASRSSSSRRSSAASSSSGASSSASPTAGSWSWPRHGTAPAPTISTDADWIVRRAWERREILPVKQLDPGRDPLLVVAPAGRPQRARRADDRRRPDGRRDRRRAPRPATDRRRAAGRGDARPVRLDRRAEPPQRRPPPARPGPRRARLADRGRQPADVPAGASSGSSSPPSRRGATTRSPRSCSSTSTTSRSSTTPWVMPPATPSWWR